MRFSRASLRAPRGAVAIMALTILLPLSAARADDLFEVFVTATDGSGTPNLTVGGSSLPNLINNLINSQGAFTSYAGVAFSANITYAGVANAINVTHDPTTGTATLTFPILGPGAQTFTFTGGNLFTQIEQFLQDNMSGQLTAFIDAINALSLVAVTDGTPISTTARSATFVYDRFGLHADQTAAEQREDGQSRRTGVRTRLDAYVERIETDSGNGNSYAIAPSFELTISEMVGIALLIPISYHEIEGSEVVNVHANLAVPVTLIPAGEISPLEFRVTPFGTLAASGSVDMVAGGILSGYGANAAATFDLGDLTLTLSSQISFHEGITLSYNGYEFDPGVHQQIMKHGVKLTHTIGDNLYIYGSIVETTFLEAAAVDDYLTPGAGIGIRTPGGFHLTAGYSGDISSNFNSHQLRFSLQLPF